MRAVFLEAPQSLLDERHRLDLDKQDEMWEGELHVVPPASGHHQRLGAELLLVLLPLAKERGLLGFYETGLFRPGAENDYRVPDLMFVRPELFSERGIEGGAEVVVEILSPRDESRAKLPWYAARGVGEMLLLDPGARAVELFRNRCFEPVTVEPGTGGSVHLETLDLTLRTVGAADGPRLLISWDGGQAEI